MAKYKVDVTSASESTFAIGDRAKAVNKSRSKQKRAELFEKLDELIELLSRPREDMPDREACEQDAVAVRAEMGKRKANLDVARHLLQRIAVAVSSVDVLADAVSKVQALIVHM